MNKPKFWGIHADPSLPLKILLGAIPFMIVISLYVWQSNVHLAENPDYKLLPSVEQMVDSSIRMATEENKRTGELLLWSDTYLSLRRMLTALAISTLLAFFLGINLGVFRGMGATLYPFITFISIIPPLAILPILFIVAGIDELGKILLIIIGTAPFMIRDVYLAVIKMPSELKVKALTLGSSQLGLTYRVVAPQVMPKLEETLLLSIGPAWLFLIAAEAIASEGGLGYRIFLVRRYLAMDVIIPYVMWITLIGLVFTSLMMLRMKYKYGWYLSTK